MIVQGLVFYLFAFVTIAAGDLDFIAPVVSMFFLISYGLLDYATYVEARAGSPSPRPRELGTHADRGRLEGRPEAPPLAG